MPRAAALWRASLAFGIFQARRKTPPSKDSAEENNLTAQIASSPYFECILISAEEKPAKINPFLLLVLMTFVIF